MTRPSIITGDHLALLAVGYGRQSTQVQFETNTGSTDYQRGQLRYPREWGWPDDRIIWLDDFGLSGTAADHRPGYLQLRSLVRRGKVSLVCVSDSSRLGRNAAELLSFLADCQAHRVLLAVDGRLLDPRDQGDWLMNAIQAVLGEHGGNTIRDTLQHGRMAKLEAGVAVSYPPVGYDSGPGKEWRMTPDPAVRSAIRTVFRVFSECRSLRATVVRLRTLDVKVPRRKPGHPIRWREATVGILQDVLNNPNYTPDYYYRRRVDDPTKPRSARGRRRIRRARDEEVRIIKDHHEGYVSREQWAEIREIFARNAWSSEHSNAGNGGALSQGLVHCGAHGERRMGVRYKRGSGGERPWHAYVCQAGYFDGGPRCIQVPGAWVDQAVTRVLVRRLEPPSIEAVRAELERLATDAREDERHRALERARLAHEIAGLEAKIDALDPTCVNALRSLAERLERETRALAALDALDGQCRKQELQDDLQLLAEATELAADTWNIWNAPTTTDRDRKELCRILVRRIVVERRTPERVWVRVAWADGGEDETIEVWTGRGVLRALEEMAAAGLSHEEIATRLNAMGLRTRRGNEFTEPKVRQSLWRKQRGMTRPATKTPGSGKGERRVGTTD